MQATSAFLLALSALTPVFARPVDNTSENSTQVLVFHNLEGEIVGERFLTKAELDDWVAHNETASDAPALETRSNNDIVFWEHFYTTCSGDWCSGSYFDVEMTYTGRDVCNDITTVANYATNACWKSWSFYGNWYWVDQCDPKSDWAKASAGSFVGNIYTYNNKFLGPCYATSHSWKDTSCSNGVQGNSWESLVRCSLP